MRVRGIPCLGWSFVLVPADAIVILTVKGRRGRDFRIVFRTTAERYRGSKAARVPSEPTPAIVSLIATGPPCPVLLAPAHEQLVRRKFNWYYITLKRSP